MNNKEIKRIAMEQSAIDLNCNIEDLFQQKNKVVISQRNDGRKKYFEQPHFGQFACYGNALVASVDKRLETFKNSFVNEHVGFRCFDMPQLNTLNTEFSKYN